MKNYGWLLSVCLASVTARAEPPAIEVRVLDAQGNAADHATFSRTLPAELGSLPGPDPDALRFLLVSSPDAVLDSVEALTLGVDGRPLDVLVRVRADAATCPNGVPPESVCRSTPALRLVADALERQHPALAARSLRAQLGGKLRLSSGGRRLVELPVTGPLAVGSLAARLRVFVLRARRAGEPAVGGTDAGARRLIQSELASAAGVWAQCGVELANATATPIEVVDPPRSQLLVVGCGLGLPASGGVLRLARGSRPVALPTRAGESPSAVALRLADALSAFGRAPSVFDNQRTADGALPSADLLLPADSTVQALADAPLSSDPTLPVCIGQVDLSDGLSHFGDGDAFAGTMEERALLRAFDDGDPSSVELFVVPRFTGAQRIGESFIVSPGSSLSSSVIIDRSAIIAGPRSFALAHELGHVFLAMPGHPDDFGVDQPWSLMDSDVADPTIFGPRRLSLADCTRALTQAGPGSITPVLRPIEGTGRAPK